MPFVCVCVCVTPIPSSSADILWYVGGKSGGAHVYNLLVVDCREVYTWEKHRDLAVKTFLENRAAMHFVTAMLVAKDLKVDQDQSTGL